MELGKSKTDWGVLGAEDVQNGVGSEVYEGKKIYKKTVKQRG